jgi:hypothetical protein
LRWYRLSLPSQTLFNKLKDTAQGRLQTVARYVEKRWISSRIRIYPITIWCVFRQAIRINNDIEGYHNDLNTQAVIVNPPFYFLYRATVWRRPCAVSFNLLNTSGMCACNDWQFYDPHPLIADVIISSFMTGVNL